MPDMFNGDPIPEDALTNPPANVCDLMRHGTALLWYAHAYVQFDRAKWGEAHGMESSRPIVDNLIAGLRQRGITTFGAVGYCYGARHVIDLAKENTIASAAVAHPSRLTIPADFHDLVEKSKAPLLINSCEVLDNLETKLHLGTNNCDGTD